MGHQSIISTSPALSSLACHLPVFPQHGHTRHQATTAAGRCCRRRPTYRWVKCFVHTALKLTSTPPPPQQQCNSTTCTYRQCQRRRRCACCCCCCWVVCFHDTGTPSGNTQTPIDARFKFAPSDMDARNNVTVADAAPAAAEGSQPCVAQVRAT